jgi:ribosomal subunit interface protein
MLSAGGCGVEDQVGQAGAAVSRAEGGSSVDIIFKGRHTDVLERFRNHATTKLAKIEKLDHRAVRIDVEVSAERNPRQAGRKERVELTVTSRGPAIRAEAAAEDRFAALDMALAKLESRLRRALDRRKGRHGAHSAVRLTDLPEADPGVAAALPEVRLAGDHDVAPDGAPPNGPLTGPSASASDGSVADDAAADGARLAGDSARAGGMAEPDADGVVPVEMQGDGPLVVREKFHSAIPMTIDQALFEMELVGHDFFLFTDERSSMPSVVYRRRGYQYGVIRLVEDLAAPTGRAQQNGAGRARPNGSAAHPAQEGSPAESRPPADIAGRP